MSPFLLSENGGIWDREVLKTERGKNGQKKIVDFSEIFGRFFMRRKRNRMEFQNGSEQTGNGK